MKSGAVKCLTTVCSLEDPSDDEFVLPEDETTGPTSFVSDDELILGAIGLNFRAGLSVLQNAHRNAEYSYSSHDAIPR